MDLPPKVAESLGHYVYVYCDPRDGNPFYIGQGKGNRVLAHLEETSESEKVARISEIRQLGLEPTIDILRYGLSAAEAKLVEAATIDLIRKKNLTNIMAGHHKSSYGRTSLSDVKSIYSAKPIAVRHQALLITINRLYRSDMNVKELYDATRGIWRVDINRAKKVKIALAVYRGVVRGVFEVHSWHPALTTNYETRTQFDQEHMNRWEFVGVRAQDLWNEYVGYSVGKGGQNPIRYRNA